MRKFFFEKGQEIKIGNLCFILADNKIDSQPYILDRVIEPCQNYVYDNYSSLDHKNFIRYMTCWQEKEQVEVKRAKKEQMKKELKTPKKTSLSAFLNKKKNTRNENPLQANNQIQNARHKKEILTFKSQIQNIKVLYVQLDTFSEIAIPSEINRIKEMFSLVYLMAKSVKKDTGIWPHMVPVLNSHNQLKFIRKGSDQSTQLINLFQYLMEYQEKELWSKNVEEFYKKFLTKKPQEYEQFKDTLVTLILAEINGQILEKEYPILINHDGVFKPDVCIITGPELIKLLKVDEEIYLQQYRVTSRTKNNKRKLYTFEHKIFESIEIEVQPQSCQFLIQYFNNFKQI